MRNGKRRSVTEAPCSGRRAEGAVRRLAGNRRPGVQEEASSRVARRGRALPDTRAQRDAEDPRWRRSGPRVGDGWTRDRRVDVQRRRMRREIVVTGNENEIERREEESEGRLVRRTRETGSKAEGYRARLGERDEEPPVEIHVIVLCTNVAV